MAKKARVYTHDTAGSGVCCTRIQVKLLDDVIQHVTFDKGCPGNHGGIEALVRGRRAGEVIDLLAGTPCGKRKTSCPDQLAKALHAAMKAK